MTEHLTTLLGIIVDNFWPLLLIVSLLSMKHFRLGGVLLILFRCISGHFEWYHFGIIAFAGVFTDWLDPTRYIEHFQRKRAAGAMSPTKVETPKNPAPRKDPDFSK